MKKDISESREDVLKRLKAAKLRKKEVAEQMKAELSEIFNPTFTLKKNFEVISGQIFGV